MMLALIISWLAASQVREAPADAFVGAWSQGPNHVMTEDDWARFDPCGCPMLIYRLGDDRIRVDRRRGSEDHVVSRHGDDFLWTLVDDPRLGIRASASAPARHQEWGLPERGRWSRTVMRRHR